MTTELLALIAAYFACSDLAEQRQLTIEEVDACNLIYQDVKLSFVPGVDARRYMQLPSEERFTVNRTAYLAFHAWQQDNPAMVRHLERVARGEVELDRDS